MKKLTLLAVAVLVACGTSADQGPDDGAATAADAHAAVDGIGASSFSIARSGARLKMRVATTADGSKEFIGWHDATLNVLCSFTVMADGRSRCLPAPAATVANQAASANTIALFSDSGCSQPLASRTPACTTWGYPYADFIVQHGQVCTTSAPAKVYQLGARHFGVYWCKASQSATCAMIDPNNPNGSFCETQAGGLERFALGPEVPLADFVERTFSVE